MNTTVQTENEASAAAVVNRLLECGVTHVVWLVDSESSSMYEALQTANNSGRLTTVPVCREGETLAIATGLMIAGKKPIVIIQNTGLYEAGDSLRGQVLDMKLPLLIMIGYRGWKPERRQMADSAAKYLEPILDAYGIPYWTLSGTNFDTLIPDALDQAEQRSGPTAILVPAEWQA